MGYCPASCGVDCKPNIVDKPDDNDEKPDNEKPNEDKPNDEKPEWEKPEDDKPNDEKPEWEKPDNEKPDEEKDCGDNPNFLFKNRKNKDCDWVATKKAKCNKQEVAKNCPAACGFCKKW